MKHDDGKTGPDADMKRRDFLGGALALSAEGVFRTAHGEAGRTGVFGKEIR